MVALEIQPIPEFSFGKKILLDFLAMVINFVTSFKNNNDVSSIKKPSSLAKFIFNKIDGLYGKLTEEYIKIKFDLVLVNDRIDYISPFEVNKFNILLNKEKIILFVNKFEPLIKEIPEEYFQELPPNFKLFFENSREMQSLFDQIFAKLEILALLNLPSKDLLRLPAEQRAKVLELTKKRMAAPIEWGGMGEPDAEDKAWINADLSPVCDA